MRTPNQRVKPSDCRIDTTPQQKRSAEIRKATSSGGSCSARPMISGTAIAPAYMTSTCCRPSVKSFGAGSISSTGCVAMAMRRVSRLGEASLSLRCGGARRARSGAVPDRDLAARCPARMRRSTFGILLKVTARGRKMPRERQPGEVSDSAFRASARRGRRGRRSPGSGR